ncbi:ATPase family associated with various cellular activities (AAA) [Burkholderia sp. YR290]|nr:ATPase family associated with various cellular activities (AAA) [Burkholderia sp. YR290]
MNLDSTLPWHELNQRYLMRAVKSVRDLVARKFADTEGMASNGDALAEPDGYPIDGIEPPPALDRLCAVFGLSPFERDILLLCAGVELDSRCAYVVACAQGDPRRLLPSFSLALAVLTDPHWSALSPDAPLRRWRLIEVGSGETLTRSPLRIDERVLHYLAGISHLDERLRGLLEAVPAPEDLPDSQRMQVDRIVRTWSASATTTLSVVQLCGEDIDATRAMAAAACALIGAGLYSMSIHSLPYHAAELDAFVRLWQREAALSGFGLLLETSDGESPDSARELALTRILEEIKGPLMVSSRARHRSLHRATLILDVSKPTAAEQRGLWENCLGEAASRLNGSLDALGAQFDLDAGAIHLTCSEALQSSTAGRDLDATLWELCRARARPRLNELAERIVPAATSEDLVLPEVQKRTLREIATHVRHRIKVYETWGFAGMGSRGLGISALFTGQSGTGKTMAGEVLANELNLDLYRIDLSQVVSKYIGETEDNLRRVFDAAEGGSVILLFDEADALFGKRSEVKDSHDRYANIEVSYLLQRMEAYRGLAILTSNMKNALDQAFLRRIRFVVQFPFPDAAQRAEIWRRVFPKKTPTDSLDYPLLSRLQLSGGNIRSMAVNAAFMAAEAQCSVRMEHLRQAARNEFIKLERPFNEAEIGGSR